LWFLAWPHSAEGYGLDNPVAFFVGRDVGDAFNRVSGPVNLKVQVPTCPSPTARTVAHTHGAATNMDPTALRNCADVLRGRDLDPTVLL